MWSLTYLSLCNWMNQWYSWLNFTFLKFLFSNWVREFGEAEAPVWEESLCLPTIRSSRQVFYGRVIHPASGLSLSCGKLFSNQGSSPSKIDSHKVGGLSRNLNLPKNMDLLSIERLEHVPPMKHIHPLLGSGGWSLCGELKEPSPWGRGLWWSSSSICAWALGTF